ncbi:hypothetical protein K227x_06080 [Rubripirellula lacrimiformis]|uniref:Uncharacterized protein n=1 Tax=Rubripirellula lacrimiformis TaxID=1930273 RepID=A0A517N527_9BACT|nr:hypothetical protein [Rubripirellula lacrimiformis]QDT02235.1 hypothetical protein K227x_06080 [Rubripirellula lacrimiformis]
MRNFIATGLLATALAITGCDVDVNETGPVPATTDGVNVDVDTPAENRLERREERRENLRDAVDNVDVKVGDGGVQVDVDGE